MTVDLNTASFDELQGLPMISPELALNILTYRDANGFFRNWSELTNVPGISKELTDEMRQEGGYLRFARAA